MLNILVWRYALALGMDGRTCGDEGGPTQISVSPFLGVAVPRGSSDTWGRVCLATPVIAMSELFTHFKASH